MLLAIDIGNTNTVLGLFQGENLRSHWRISTHKKETADELSLKILGLFYGEGIVKNEISAVVISSVVSILDYNYHKVMRKLFGLEPLLIDHTLDMGILVKTDYPEEVGADRLVNAAACYLLHGGCWIIVDFGTATTFCVVSGKGEYLGGAIAPGIAVSAEALFSSASKLPRIDIAKPPTVIGRNTVHGIQSGLFYGYASLVEGMIVRMKECLAARGEEIRPRVMFTGGLASLMAEVCDFIDKVEPNLTLKGLYLIYRRNSRIGVSS